jgi:F-type H+-transporting ATPase subunit c
MKKSTVIVMLAIIAVSMLASVALASEGGGSSDAAMNYFGMAVLGCGLAVGLAGLGTGIGMGSGLGRACEGVARNPGVSNKIMTTLIVGLAIIESLAIYALVVALIVLFTDPFKVLGG